MKNYLKSMLAIGAAMCAMNFAKAESKEVVFEPTNRDGAEIDRIELVNGQILVRAPKAVLPTQSGKEVATPYVYVGTNTQHFAESAFAQPGLERVDQYVHAGKGKVYMTLKDSDDVWTTQVSSSPNLNGVRSVYKVEGAEADAIKALLKVKKQSEEDGYITKIFDGELYRADDKVGIRKYNVAEGKWRAKNTLNVDGGHIVDFEIVSNGDQGDVTCYTTVEDANKEIHRYRNSTEIKENGDNANESSVNRLVKSLPKDVKSYIVTDTGIYWAKAKTFGYTKE